HNIPEGMAVGVVLAGMMSQNAVVTAGAAFALSVGIAIQNFPEGAIISMPLRSEGNSKSKSFLYGLLSGAVEPIAGLLTIILTGCILAFMPYILSFAAGAMMYVVVEELLPEATSNEKSNIGTIGFSIGFALMMVLDVVLG
ncbi:MAG: ZIP family metal transporter, partial [Treponema sp.]|nr:ZIP family metal transporter [Treponema sp.]